MPDKAMAHDMLAVVFGQLDKCVGVGPEVAVAFGMYLLAFHHVFRHEGIEMLQRGGLSEGVLAGDLASVEGRAEKELVFECLVEAGGFFRGGGGGIARAGAGKEER